MYIYIYVCAHLPQQPEGCQGKMLRAWFVGGGYVPYMYILAQYWRIKWNKSNIQGFIGVVGRKKPKLLASNF